jgi:hypothetical protein
MNDFAKLITLREGKKISLPIGQVKEVIRLVMEELRVQSDEGIIKIVRRSGKK